MILLKPTQFASFVAQRSDDHVGPESSAVFTDPPAFVLEAAQPLGLGELVLRQLASECVRRIEHREVVADDLIGAVALEALCPGVPGVHPTVRIEQEDGVVSDRLDEEAKTFLAVSE